MEINKDFIIKKYAGGIKLVTPEDEYHYDKPSNESLSQKTVGDLLTLPLNIIFLNRESIIQNINESNAATLGCSSMKAALGKTIRSVYKKGPADFSIYHDQEVMMNGKMSIKEECCERTDDISFQAITAKAPLYNNKNEIIGLLGCSISIGLESAHSIQEALLAFVKLEEIFSQNSNRTSCLPGKIVNGKYLSPREVECLKYLVQGHTAKETGRILNLSPRTVEAYLNNAKMRLGIETRSELIVAAFNHSTHSVMF